MVQVVVDHPSSSGIFIIVLYFTLLLLLLINEFLLRSVLFAVFSFSIVVCQFVSVNTSTFTTICL